MKIYIFLISCQVLLGQTLGHANLMKHIQYDEFNETTSDFLIRFINSMNMTIDDSSSTTYLYNVILDTLKALNKYKFWLPCVIDVGSVMYAIGNGIQSSDLWALQMIDSGTKWPSGILTGNIIDLGMYDECVKVKHGNITGQHCLIDTVFHFRKTTKSESLLLNGNLKITMSQCFPASCEPYMLRIAYAEVGKVLTSLFSSKNTSVTVEIPDSNCHTLNGRRGLDGVDISVLIILAGLLVIITAVSVVDYMVVSKRAKDRSLSKGELAVQAFSVYGNFKKLFNLKQSPEQMSCINGIKFLSISWVVLGHKYSYTVLSPLVNLIRIAELADTWYVMIILSAILSVDTFFIISGLLNAYIVCTIRDKMSSRRLKLPFVLYSYVHRYIRLTPAYLIMMALTSTWLYRLSDGPIWDKMVGVASKNCRKNFWPNLIYLNNYISPGDDGCMMQSWYLAADMQMFWISPFVIYPVWRWPIFGYIYLFILGCVSLISPILISYYNNIRTPIPIGSSREQELQKMTIIYFPTHTKTLPYVIGIFVGYILYRIRIKKNMKVQMSRITASIIWVLALLSMTYAVFGGHYLYSPKQHLTQLESSLYIGFFKLFWAVGVSWVILACTTGYGGFINSFLSLPIFGPLGKLTYGIYLTHAFVLLCTIGSMRVPNYLDDYKMVQETLGEMVVIIAFSTVITLVSDSPLIILEKLLFESSEMRRSKEINEQHVDLKNKTDEYTNELNRFAVPFPEGKGVVNPSINVISEELNPALNSILSRG